MGRFCGTLYNVIVHNNRNKWTRVTCINIVAERAQANQQIPIIPNSWCLNICEILSLDCRGPQHPYISHNLNLVIGMRDSAGLTKASCYAVNCIGRGPQGREVGVLQRPGLSAVQTKGNELCQQPEWAWKQILPQSGLQMRMRSSQNFSCGQWDLGQKIQLNHTWTPDPQKLWDNKCMSF